MAKPLKFVVIGAGMAGILMGYRLKQAGFNDFTIYEKGESVGGTWRENRYPGLHCDVPSHHYCYSFAPNPDWSKEYSPGPEIWAYFDRTARNLGVMDHIRFNAQVAEARWTDGRWNITLANGQTDKADVLISATGVLHKLVYPDIEGLKSFAGTSFHTARWDHSVDLTDKRIGIIGTGSTAVQIVAELSDKVRKLTLFQRTAQWVAKVENPAMGWFQRLLLRLQPSRMRKLYDAAMATTEGVVAGIMGGDPAAHEGLLKNVQDNLASVRDPELRRKLTPNYAPGCKRLIMSPNFYEAIQRPACEVVTERIARIEPRGIVTADGKLHELDVLVIATGFDPTAYVRPVRLIGENGIDLETVWKTRPIAYRAVAVPHMPNFFMIGGPFSPFGNISNILMAETQTAFIMRCVEHIASEGVTMRPRLDVTEKLISGYREAAKTTVWAEGGCQSYYLDPEGIPIIYPFAPRQYLTEMAVAENLADFVTSPA